MIKKFVEAFEMKKDELKKYLEETPQSKYSRYFDLVKLLVEKVFIEYNAESITEIDDGYFQGTLLFLVPEKTYQPSVDEYIFTYVYYGSCSGCDTLQGIHQYSDGLPDDEQVKDYMTLLLHIVQNIQYLSRKEEN